MADTKEEIKEEKKEFYKVKIFPPKEQKGEKINQTPRLGIDGGVYEGGQVVALSKMRLKSVGEQYFEKLTEKEYNEWIESGQKKRFIPEQTNKK